MKLKGFFLLASLFAFGLNSSFFAQQEKLPAKTATRTEAKTGKKKTVKLQKRKKAKTEDVRMKADTSQKQKASSEPKIIYKR